MKGMAQAPSRDEPVVRTTGDARPGSARGRPEVGPRCWLRALAPSRQGGRYRPSGRDAALVVVVVVVVFAVAAREGSRAKQGRDEHFRRRSVSRASR
jgi:hypothetical protein